MPRRKNKIKIHFQNKGGIFNQNISPFFLPHILKGRMVEGGIGDIFYYALDAHS